jgi:hypothetical protein
MGSAAKAIKKVTKSIKKPFSKMTKGIAKGIMKVGKATMRGVAKISNKLGPIGMIAMSMAMPYAMSGLSGMIGQGAVSGYHGATGWMGSQNVFLKSIGTVGNAIRTGYQGVTGFVKTGMKGITRSITEGFSNMGKGNNLWSKVSNGAKTLFNKSRAAVRRLKPITSKGGSVDVMGYRGSIHGDGMMTSVMSNTNAAQLLESGAIQGDQLIGQSWGKTGWLTKANPMDKAVSEAINSTYETNIMSNFDGTAKKAFFDYKSAADASGQNYNYQSIDNLMRDNMTSNIDKIDSGSIGFDFSKSGDYNLHNPNEPTSYKFNGNKTFKTNNGKSTLAKKVTSAVKSSAYNNLTKGLLTPTAINLVPTDMSLMGDTTQQTDGATTFGGTTIQGSSGGSLLKGAFSDAEIQKIMGYYRHMNITGSH